MDQLVLPKEFLIEFYRMSKQQLTTLFEILHGDSDQLYSLLQNIHNSEVIDTLIQKLDQPQCSQVILQSIRDGQFKMLKNYLKDRITLDDLLALNQEQDEGQNQFHQQEPVVQTSQLLFLPKHLYLRIMEFLDPLAFVRSKLICRTFLVLYSEPKINETLYGRYCSAFFSQIRKLPDESPFTQIIHFINHNHHLYSAGLIEQANQNIRGLVWGEMEEQEQPLFKQIKQKYQSFREMFYGEPRLNYCGIYGTKEEYIKEGEQGFSQSYRPYHLVEFFRYVRFWPDGSLTMMITTQKLKRNVLLDVFSQKQPDSQKYQDQVVRGEYQVKEGAVKFITFRQGTIFPSKAKISQRRNGIPGDILIVEEQKMSMIGDNYVTDLQQKNQFNCTKKCIYRYKHYEELRKSICGNSPWGYVVY